MKNSGCSFDCLIFAFVFKRTSGTKLQGELLLGGIDEALFTGPVNWLPVTAKGYWQIKMDRFIPFSSTVAPQQQKPEVAFVAEGQ